MLDLPVRYARVAIAVLLAGLLVFAALSVGSKVTPAEADSAPLNSADPTTPVTVSADPLPTVQINGVAWAQVVVGNTVYVAGKFTSARPAGAAAGTNETPRNNLLAYDIRTGNLITSFAPSLNAQALAIAASPDGSRIYVGGDFTTADGQSRSRIAAYSTATGQLVPTFKPTVSTTVRAVVATDSTVWFGGDFSAVGGVSRSRLAAVSATDGTLKPFAPAPGPGRNSDGSTAKSSGITALALTGNGTQLVVGGRFGYMNGSATSGIAAVDAATGASNAFAAGQVVTNQGDNSGITSISTDGNTVWFSAYDFNGPGNMEGVVAARADGGAVIWDADCRGDTYSTFPLNGAVYVAGHPHVCSNIGGYPEVTPRVSQYGLAYSQAAAGVVGTANWTNTNFRGAAAPAVTNWYPTFYTGTFTGQGQAGWSVAGNSQYVVYGGEFGGVNNLTTQGLVRFAVPAIAPNKVGPRAPSGTTWAPTTVAVDGGGMRVSWPTVSDRDNQYLSYSVYRDGGKTPVYTSQPENSLYYQVHNMGFKDVGLAPGSSHSYVVKAVDPFGNTLSSAAATATVSTAPSSAYAAAVQTDTPSGYWPLQSLTGSTSYDQVAYNDITAGSGMTVAQGSPLGTTSLAADGTSNGRGTVGATSSATVAPNTYSLELWFNTTSTTGGRLAGFGNDPKGANSSYDRMVFMDDAGILVYGVYTGNTETIATRPGLNDGQWHHVVAELSPAGMAFYVDGVLIGSKAGVTAGQPYSGWWQVGGGNLGGWPANRSTDEYTGQLAQVAVYPAALSKAQVRAHYTATGRTVAVQNPPTDAYGAAVAADSPSLYWRLDDAAGATTTADASESGTNTGQISGSVGRSAGVGLPGKTSGAFDLAGNGGYVVAKQQTSNPTSFTTSAWFSTTSTDGGRIVGFGNSQNARSGNYDRFVYMFADGRLRFGVWGPGEQVIDTPRAYNDGDWHQVSATFGPGGMALYVDGQLVGTNANTSVAGYDGYWRVGSDNIWGGANTAALNGRVDEVAVYDHALTAARVQAQYAAAGQTGVGPQPRPTDAYGAAVYDSAPTQFWPMTDTSGTRAASAAPNGNRAGYAGNPTLGVPGPGLRGGSGTTAVGFDGVDDGLYSPVALNNPSTFSTELWFSTTSTAGGKLIGFGDRQTGLSGNYDRHVYLQPDGHLVFGTWTGQANLVTSAKTYNDGNWHQMVATMGADGMHLYVDGAEVGSNPNTGAQSYTGYWRVGGDSPWSGNAYLRGSIGEVSIYDRALPATEVAGHWSAASGPVDTAPTAAFTTTVTGLSVAFDGTTSKDTEGPIATYAWTFGDGTSGTGASVAHAYTAPGTYQAVLTVTDGAGQSTSTAQAVTVSAPPNVAPTADFSSAATDLSVALDGRASADTDGSVAGWAWDFGDGSTGTGSQTTHAYGAAGSYTVTLTVTDDRGATGTATRSVAVTAPNKPPTATFTSTPTDLVLAVDGSASADADGAVASWAWDFGDGGTATGRTATHTYAAAGTYAVKLAVTDDKGATGTSTTSVTVTAAAPVDQPPTAAFTSSVSALTASLDGRTSTDADGTVTAWAWDFGDGSTGTGATTSRTYAAEGTYTVTLTVTDDKGVTATTSSTVTVTRPANVAPTATFSIAANGLAAAVDASGSTDPDGSITAYSWDFGDGSAAVTGRTATHTYAAAGSYPVTLTVTDDRAGTASTSSTVVVTPVLARDSFSREVASGWGAAELGGTWTTGGTASVTSGAGVLTAAAGRSSIATLPVSRTDIAVQATVQVPSATTGGGTYASIGGQRNGTSDYRVKVWMRPTGDSQATLVRVVNNVETTLASYSIPNSAAAGTAITVRFDLSGASTGTTALRAKVWVAGTTEPTGWNLQATDSTAALQQPGLLVINEYVSGSSTTSSTVRVDDLWVGFSGAAPGR
jgi:PKD repeat protein